MNSARPRVSIVVPFFNAEQFLGEAVGSVFAQSFADWELLLVDDGSTDASSLLARRLAQEGGGKIRSLSHPDGANRGIGASLNLGIHESTGDLIALLDSDDVWLPTKLDEQVAILDSHPRAAMVYGPSQYWYSWTGRVEDQPRDRVETLGVPADSLVEAPKLLLGLLKRRVSMPCPSSVLLRKPAVEGVGGFEESSARTNHFDRSFYAKLFLADSVYVSGQCWARYRQHPDSSVTTTKGLREQDAEERSFLEWFAWYVANAGIRSVEVGETLQRRLSDFRYRTSSPLGRLVRSPARAAKGVAKRSIPTGAVRRLRRLRGAGAPPTGQVRFGDFRRLQPFSRRWGYDRGLPIDRYYIETFLERESADIRGRVMEVGDNAYTWRFGREAVTGSDVLNLAAGDPKTTLVGDLAEADHFPSNRFDCIIFTETLHFLYDFRAGLRTLHRMLKPGGVLLATFPGVTKIGRPEDWGTSWYWSFTPLSARRVFEETFSHGEIAVDAFGNVLSATAFLWGIAADELWPEELEHKDPEYPVTITVRAVKTDGASRRE
jgi:glycosyltransferase involved in cell wall biosynthesis/SAM-dependent methyltransferase